MVFHNLNIIFSQWKEDFQITVYLKGNPTQKELEIFRKKLKSYKEVKELRYVPKDEALRLFKESLEGQNGLLEGLGENPFPSSFELQLLNTYKNQKDLKRVVGQLKSEEFISDIQYTQEWFEKFSAFLDLFKLVVLLIGTVLLLAVTFIISNTIKLTILARKDEVEIMRLIGATDSFIKAPFVIEGFLQGLIGSVISLLMLFLSYRIISAKAFFTIPYLVFLPSNFIIAVIVGGTALGIFGSNISLGRFLKL